MSPNSFYLYLVLSAKEAFDPMSLGLHRDAAHVTPCSGFAFGAGTSFLVTERAPEEFSMPQKGRTLKVWSNLANPTADIVKHLAALVSDPNAQLPPALTPGLLYIEHQTPFSMHRVLTKDAMLYAHGLWTNQHEVLVLTNVENYDLLVQLAQPRNLWLHRMRPEANANVTVNTQRMCSRWARWVRDSTVLAHSSERFSSLETALFSLHT